MQLDELNKKIEEAFNSDLVGEVIFSKDELEQIPSTLSKHYNFEYSHYLDTDDAKKIFVYITNLTRELKLSGSNERWRPYIKKYLDFLGVDTWSDAPLNNLFIALFERLKDTGVVLITQGGKQYYDTFACHAIAPTESWNSFFELCWFYLFRHPLFDNDEEHRRLISDQLARRFRLQIIGENYIADESIKIGSQSYGIRIGIKALGLTPYKDMLYNIIMKVYDCQSKINLNQPIDQSNYINHLFSAWYDDLKNNAATKMTVRGENSDERISFIPSVFYKYDSETKKIYITASKFYSLSNLGSNADLEINFYFDNKKIYSRKFINIDNDELFCTITGLDIDINTIISRAGQPQNILSDLTADITLNDELLIYQENVAKYDLRRDFILFPVNVVSTSKETTKHECAVKPYYLYIGNQDINTILKKHPRNCSLRTCVYSIIPVSGEELVSKNNHVLFVDEAPFEKTAFYPRTKQSQAFYRYKGVSYEICKSVVLRVDKSQDLSSMWIKCVGTNGIATDRPLSNFYDEEYIVETERYKTIFLQLSRAGINWLHPFTMNLYDQYHNPQNIICSASVIRIDAFSVLYGSDLTTEHSFSISTRYYIKNDFVLASLIVKKNDSGEFVTPFLDGELILLNPPVITVKLFDDTGYQFVDELKDIYYRDIPDDASISFTPDGISFDVHIENWESNVGYSYYDFIENSELNRFGEYVHSLANKKNIEAYRNVYVRYSDPRTREYTDDIYLFRIYFKPSFVDFPIKITGETRSIIIWKPGQLFGGNGLSSFAVKFINSETKKEYTYDNLGFTQQEINADMQYGNYKCTIYAKNVFGGLIEISCEDVKYGADDLINDAGTHIFEHIHMIDEKQLQGNYSYEDERIYKLQSNLLIDNSVKISEYKGNPVYIGDLYVCKMPSKGEKKNQDPIYIRKVIWVRHPDPKVMNVACVRFLSNDEESHLVSADYYQGRSFESFGQWKIGGKLLYSLLNRGKAFREYAADSSIVLALSQ